MSEVVLDPERLEIDRAVNSDEYEAVQLGEWKKWHAVAPDTDQTMCGLRHVNQRALRMWHRWVLEEDRCRRCERVIKDAGTHG